MSYKNRTFIKTTDRIAQFVQKSNDTIQKVGDINNLSASVFVDSDLVSAVSSIADSVGTATLTTTAQTLKGAINEHETDIGNMTFTGLSATNISSAIRELRTELGDHSALTTTATSNVVAAINEINSELYTSPDGSGSNFNTTAATIEGAINELDSDIGEIVDLSDSVRAENSTAIAAINYVWQYAKQIDRDQSTGDNLLGNLSTLDDQIERSSFALSINALRDSVNAIGARANGGLRYDANRDFSVDSSDSWFIEAVRSTLSNGTGVSYSGGELSIGQSVATSDNVTFHQLDLHDRLAFTRTGPYSNAVIIDSTGIQKFDGSYKLQASNQLELIAGENISDIGNIFMQMDSAVYLKTSNSYWGMFRRYQDSDLLIQGKYTGGSKIVIADSSVTIYDGLLKVEGDSALTATNTTSADGALSWNRGQIAHRTASPTDLSQDNSNLTFIQDISFTFDSHGHATASSVGTATISAGTYLSNSGSTINHDNTTRSNTTAGTTTLTPGGTFAPVTSVSSNTQGHVTATNTPTFTMPATGDTLSIYDAGGTLLKTIKSYT